MNKDIDKAAREYAECSICKGCDTEKSIKCGSYDGFIAGAQSRQSEIDELTKELEGSHRMEEIARQTLLRKRNKIGELVEALEEAMKWISVDEGSPEVGATVLIKVGDSNKFVSTAHFAHERFIIDFYDMRDDEPTHWRPIDTPKATQLLEKYGKKWEKE